MRMSFLFFKPVLIPIHLYLQISLYRSYAAHIKRPFSVKYDPYTHSIELLDNPQKIHHSLENVRDELHALIDALNVIS